MAISAPPIKGGFYLLYPSSDIIAPMHDRYTWREPQHRKTRELMALEHPQNMTFGANDDIDLACLGVHFSVAEAHDGIHAEEYFSTPEEIDTLHGQQEPKTAC